MNDDAPQHHARKPRIFRYLLIALLGAIGIAGNGILERRRDDEALAKWTEARTIPTVDVTRPSQARRAVPLVLPADIQAFDAARIHARVSGYVKGWYKDIGAHVKAGDVLAEIDTPDLDQKFAQAKGELAKAQADYSLAALTAKRWASLRASAAVSQQTADEKQSDAEARKADVVAAQANLDRLHAMESFKSIVAPFDGTVTARHIDIGSLVSATGSNEQPLFEVSATAQVRVYVRVPQTYAGEIHPGMRVSVALPQYPGRRFVGTVETTSDAIAQQSRTLLVEALFDNDEGLLVPGGYARASFDLPLDSSKLIVPANTLIFRSGPPEVAVVEDGKVRLQSVEILRDIGNEIEIASGVSREDAIVVNPTDTILAGDTVKVAHPSALDPAAGDVRHEAQK